MKHALLLLLCCTTLAGCLDQSSSSDDAPASSTASNAGMPPATPTPPTDPLPAPTLPQLGQLLFSDTSLSSNGTQSCASCHDAGAGFADPDRDTPVSAGAVTGAFGTRNAPTAAYAARIPPLTLGMAPGQPANTPPRWFGGLFLDGRADSPEAQAAAPFFNPGEMNLADAADPAAHLRGSPVRAAFEAYYGADSLAAGTDSAQVLTRTTAAIAAFERSAAVMPYSSKFDAVLRGQAAFTAQEQRGFDLFRNPDAAGCAGCHDLRPGSNNQPPVLSDFTYANLGVPRNPDRDFFTADFVDSGLEATLLARDIPANNAARQRGHFRVPTLRNVAHTAPYMHNGVFADLHTVVEFYNTRDSDPARWATIGAAESPDTIGPARPAIGNLHLSADDVDAIVAFLGTLSDGYTP